MTSTGVDGLSNALLSIASDESQIALLHRLLDRYCHRFRNRLNSMKLSLYLGRKASGGTGGSHWRDLENRYLVLEHLLEQFQQFCHPFEVTPMEVPLQLFLEELRRAWNHRFSGSDLQIELIPLDHPVKGMFDPSRMLQGLETLAHWRGAVLPQGSTILLSCWEREGWLHLRWEEQEPHTPPVRARTDDHESHANIALPILARILQAHGGTLKVSGQERFVLTLSWPGLPIPNNPSPRNEELR